MGKKKITTMDDSQNKAVKKAKKEIFRWEEAYTDLSAKVANALRDARLKPEQLSQMADGEILSIEGLDGNNSLEEIRAHYPAGLVETKSTKESETKEEVSTPQKKASTHPSTKYPRALHGRSATYETKKDLLKVNLYPLSTAVKMLREISYSVHKTVELHLNTKEIGVRGELTLPHSAGKQTKVAIFSKELETKIKSGTIDFDILLAKPQDMPSIAPLAKVLGPKGLMPNPKSNTVVTDPEKRKAELEKGALLTYRTEAKQKVMHLSIGSLNQKDKELVENIQTVLNGIGLNKITTGYLKSTMSPSIKLDLTNLE